MERTWKPTTAGILTIIAGGLGIGAGAWITLAAIPLGLGGAMAGAIKELGIISGLLAGLAGVIGICWSWSNWSWGSSRSRRHLRT
jgi:hypothetical protein